MLPLVAILAGCAISEDFAYKRAQYDIKYFDTKRACEAAGGHIVMQNAHIIRENSAPDFGTVYYCTK